MAAKETKEVTKLMKVGAAVPEPPAEFFTQRKSAEVGRYRLLIDRQLKRSYMTSQEAEAAGLAIKQKHPVVQVVVYDADEGVNLPIELPKA